MSDVLTDLRSYREELDDRAPAITLTEITTPIVTSTAGRRGPWLLVAASLAAILIAGLLLIINQSNEVPPASSVVPTTIVDPAPTTVVTPTTTPTGQDAGAAAGESAVGDDEIVVAMAQSFPLAEAAWTNGPNEATGQTAGIRTSGELDGPADAEALGEFSVEFRAFETEGLSSAYLESRMELPEVIEVQPLTGLGDEASVMFVEGNWRTIATHGHALVRHGRFVAETVVLLYGDSDPEALIAQAAEVAVVADETMHSVLSFDIQPLPAPPPETLTSYEMNVWVYNEPGAPGVHSIVTPEGYGCMFYENDEAQPGVAEIGGDAYEQVDWDEGWFPSTTDSPGFQNGKDICQTWSPHLEESYLGDLIRRQEGHVGIDRGRQTLSYWFTKEDLLEAGVLTDSDSVEISRFHLIVDQAGPWLMSLRVDFEGDAEAIRRLVLLDVPDLETAYSFSIDIGYGIIDDGHETWADRLDAWVQPRR